MRYNLGVVYGLQTNLIVVNGKHEIDSVRTLT